MIRHGGVYFSRQLDEPRQELLGDRFVEHQSRSGDAGLTLVVEDREGGTVDRRRQIGVGEHDVGALATELELDSLEVAR